MHLECSPHEWHVLEDFAEVLQPFKVATEHLSGAKYPTVSAVGPLLSEIKAKIEVSCDDGSIIKGVKEILAIDMNKRYQDDEVVSVLNILSFLDPQFKTLVT